MTALRVRPEADRDTDQAADFYLREAGLEIALRFLDAVDRAYQRLVEHPLIGTPVTAFEPRLEPLRSWPVPGFECTLVFHVPCRAWSRSSGCSTGRATFLGSWRNPSLTSRAASNRVGSMQGRFCLLLPLAVALALAGTAQAQDDWRLTIEPYVWIPALEGEGSADGSPEVDFEIDYPGELSAALPLALRLATPGGSTWRLDGLYARWEDDEGSIETETSLSLVEAGVGWPTGGGWELVAGLRAVELELDVAIGGAEADASESWIDPWLGAAGEVELAERWTVRTWADVGGFGIGSDLTWQVAALAGWRGERWRVELGYRALAVAFDDDDLDTELLAHGPILGVAFEL